MNIIIFSHFFSQSGKEECTWSDGNDDVSGSRVHVN